LFRSAVLIAALVAASCSRPVPSLAGDWDATIVNLAKAEVPFRFVIGGTPDQPTGMFVNGDEQMPSTGGSVADGQLTIEFAQYGSKVVARRTQTIGRLHEEVDDFERFFALTRGGGIGGRHLAGRAATEPGAAQTHR